MTSNEMVRPMGQDLVAGQVGGQADPAARPVRRTFTAEYRAQMVAPFTRVVTRRWRARLR